MFYSRRHLAVVEAKSARHVVVTDRSVAMPTVGSIYRRIPGITLPSYMVYVDIYHRGVALHTDWLVNNWVNVYQCRQDQLVSSKNNIKTKDIN